MSTFKTSNTWKRIRQSWIDKHADENETSDKRKSVSTSLMNLFGDVAATIDIDVHIDVQRVKCCCTSPSGYPTPVTATDNHDGTFTLEMDVTEGGVYKCDVTTDDNPIKGSPFLIKVHQTGDKEKVKMTGVGLHSVTMLNAIGVFQIDTQGAGPGELEVHIDGPKDGFHVVMSRDQTDGRVVCVDYNPELEGVYNINVFWDGYHVPGSPRLVFIAPDETSLEKWMKNPSLMLEDKDEKDEKSTKDNLACG